MLLHAHAFLKHENASNGHCNKASYWNLYIAAPVYSYSETTRLFSRGSGRRRMTQLA
jgi:hypothetical protein